MDCFSDMYTDFSRYHLATLTGTSMRSDTGIFVSQGGIIVHMTVDTGYLGNLCKVILSYLFTVILRYIHEVILGYLYMVTLWYHEKR